jgi:hypothetical protein
MAHGGPGGAGGSGSAMAMAGAAACIDLRCCPSSSAGSAAGAWSRVAAVMPAGVSPLPLLPIGGGPRARVGAVLSPIFVTALSPTSGSALSPPSVCGTVPLLPLHGVCGDLPPRLERLGWRASAWARRPIRASRRIQVERAAAGFGVAAAERNHCVQFGIPRCSLRLSALAN